METLVEKADHYAERKHLGHYRDDKITPFIIHPRKVKRLLEDIGIDDENILASSLLHDVIENCGVSVEELEKEFNPEVARIVGALTRDVSRQMYKERIGKSDYAVQIIKLADVVHNSAYLYNSKRTTIEHKIQDSFDFYLPLAKVICSTFYRMLLESVSIAETLLDRD